MTKSVFVEDNFRATASPKYSRRCASAWQADCRRAYADADASLRHRLCETELDRQYVRIRTLVPPSSILKNWEWERRRRDYDLAYVRARLPTFTPTGFALRRLPPQLHGRLGAWYERRRNFSIPAPNLHDTFGSACNTGHDNDDWVAIFSGHATTDELLVADVTEWIRRQLAEWTGQVVNEKTAVYGARQYHRGSVCGMHTDNAETHAFSAIVQIDQRGMDQPWALDFVTHADEERQAYMEPGDVMLCTPCVGPPHTHRAPSAHHPTRPSHAHACHRVCVCVCGR